MGMNGEGLRSLAEALDIHVQGTVLFVWILAVDTQRWFPGVRDGQNSSQDYFGGNLDEGSDNCAAIGLRCDVKPIIWHQHGGKSLIKGKVSFDPCESVVILVLRVREVQKGIALLITGADLPGVRENRASKYGEAVNVQTVRREKANLLLRAGVVRRGSAYFGPCQSARCYM